MFPAGQIMLRNKMLLISFKTIGYFLEDFLDLREHNLLIFGFAIANTCQI
jgi:hypothetical protein